MTTVLVVEDNSSQRKLLSKLLQRMELNVIFADNGVEALELVQSHCPNLVILDIVMPRMNGYEVCRRLKSDEKTQEIAVLMFSAKKEECDRHWGIKQGADAYMSKPCHPQELVDTVNYLLQNKRIH